MESEWRQVDLHVELETSMYIRREDVWLHFRGDAWKSAMRTGVYEAHFRGFLLLTSRVNMAAAQHAIQQAPDRSPGTQIAYNSSPDRQPASSQVSYLLYL